MIITGAHLSSTLAYVSRHARQTLETKTEQIRVKSIADFSPWAFEPATFRLRALTTRLPAALTLYDSTQCHILLTMILAYTLQLYSMHLYSIQYIDERQTVKSFLPL